MTFHWHDLLPLRDDIDRMTAGVNAGYALVFGGAPHPMNGSSCATGYTDFTNHLCWLNASAIHAPAAEQFVFTVFLAAHERAHARWTNYDERDFDLLDASGAVKTAPSGRPLPDRALHQCWNILEDERIERLLGRNFPHLHPYLHAGSTSFLKIVRMASDTDDPGEVLQHILRRRIARRTGLLTPCRLSPANRDLLKQCEPLLDEAFSATSSRRVVELARAILKILKLEAEHVPVMDALSGQCGERQAGEIKHETASEEEGRVTDAGDSDVEQQATDRMKALGYSPGQRSGGKIQPASYDELQQSVQPYVSRVRPLFDVLPVRRRVEFESSGGRLSIRAARQDLRAPFRVESAPVSPGPVALTLVVDDSGSMRDVHLGMTGEREGKRTAMLCLNALPLPHRVRVVLAPSGREAADPSFGEMSRARIAGYDSPEGTAYADVLSEECTRLQEVPRAFSRYLVLVADGATSPADLVRCRTLVKSARAAQVHVFGIGVGEGGAMRAFFDVAFGDQYVALSSMESLVPQMQRILQRMAHHTRRS